MYIDMFTLSDVSLAVHFIDICTYSVVISSNIRSLLHITFTYMMNVSTVRMYICNIFHWQST